MTRLASLAAVLVALAASIATSAELIDSVARIQVGNSYGSGTYIGSRLVLTAAHVPRGENPDSVMVHFRDGVAYHGRVVGSDPSWDQAVIELDKEPNVRPIQIAHTNPRQGETLWAAGYEHGTNLVIKPVRLVTYASNAANATLADWVSYAGTVQGGASGGPIFNGNGRLVGNIWGSDTTTISSLSTGRTQRFLLPWNARLRAIQLQQWRWRPRQRSTCGTGQTCPPGIRTQTQGYRFQYEQSPALQIPPPSPPQVSLPPTSTPEIDYDRLADVLADKLKDDPAFRGRAGPAGETGPPGRDGQDGKPGQSNVEQLTLITSSLEQLTQRLRSLETSTFDVTVVNRATKTTQTGKVNPHGGSLEITLDPVPVQGR